MGCDSSAFDHDREYCNACERRTDHDVTIEIRAETAPGNGEEAVASSREPYRVATCSRCGTERARRMNDA